MRAGARSAEHVGPFTNIEVDDVNGIVWHDDLHWKGGNTRHHAGPRRTECDAIEVELVVQFVWPRWVAGGVDANFGIPRDQSWTERSNWHRGVMVVESQRQSQGQSARLAAGEPQRVYAGRKRERLIRVARATGVVHSARREIGRSRVRIDRRAPWVAGANEEGVGVALIVGIGIDVEIGMLAQRGGAAGERSAVAHVAPPLVEPNAVRCR